MSGRSVQQLQSIKGFFTPKVISDIKFCLSASAITLFLIFYYAWLMRKLINDPYMSTSSLLYYFGTYAVVFFFLISALLYFIYPNIYKDFLEEEEDKKTQ